VIRKGDCEKNAPKTVKQAWNVNLELERAAVGHVIKFCKKTTAKLAIEK
jgi:hypothetical protein